jgi:hypothetical protein
LPSVRLSQHWSSQPRSLKHSVIHSGRLRAGWPNVLWALQHVWNVIHWPLQSYP